MSNWDLMMPGMGLTSIGLAGVTISYAGIAHTFVDGMHALTGLTMFIGLIFLAAGILDGGISTSNRAKATTLVVVSIALAFGTFAFTMNTLDSTNIFAGILLILVIPAIVMAYVSAKMPQYLKPIGIIFTLAAGAGIATFIAFGMVGPEPYLLPAPQEVATEVIEEEAPKGPIYTIAILEGSSEKGNPDYDPDQANVPQGYVVEWINEDSVAHTVTSSDDLGETFDSGLLDAGAKFTLDTTDLAIGEYEYMCIVHPWMTALLLVEEPQEQVKVEVSIPQGAGVQKVGQKYYDPELVTVSPGTTVEWINNDETIHTVTSKDELFDSELISAGDSYENTFTKEGSYDYFCIVHPWMEGTVIVE